MDLFICIKMDLALNNLQWLMCHKTKPNQTKRNQIKSSRLGLLFGIRWSFSNSKSQRILCLSFSKGNSGLHMCIQLILDNCLRVFPHRRKLIGFHWSLNNNKISLFLLSGPPLCSVGSRCLVVVAAVEFLVEIRWSVYISKPPQKLFASHSPGRILVCVYTIW